VSDLGEGPRGPAPLIVGENKKEIAEGRKVSLPNLFSF